MNNSMRLWGLTGSVVALLAASAAAQPATPVFSLEVAAINNTVLKNLNCASSATCPGNGTCVASKCTNATTLSQADGDIAPGDSILLEAYVRNWDADVTLGRCQNGADCSTTAQNCAGMHCTLNAAIPCTSGEDCAPLLGQCVADTCTPYPLLNAAQFKINETVLEATGACSDGRFNSSVIACNPANCNYNSPPVNNCPCAPGFTFPGTCTCTVAGVCDAMTNTCINEAIGFIDLVRSDYLMVALPRIFAVARLPVDTWEFLNVAQEFGAGVVDQNPTVKRYLGSLRLTATNPIYGTVNILMDNDPQSTFAADQNVVSLPGPNLEGVTITFNNDPCCGVVCTPANECQTSTCVNGICVPGNKPNGTTCNLDGNLCTQDTCQSGGCNQGAPKICPPNEACDPTDGVCKPVGGCQIVSMSPPNCEIDARQPHNIGNTVPAQGVTSFQLTFNAGCDTSGFGIAAYGVRTVPGSKPAPGILSVSGVGNVATVTFDAPIPTNNWTCVAHNASATEKCFGFLPADVNASRTANAADITALINSLNNVTPRPITATDMNRSAATNASDITRLIDLLNGASAFDPWQNQRITAVCPTP